MKRHTVQQIIGITAEEQGEERVEKQKQIVNVSITEAYDRQSCDAIKITNLIKTKQMESISIQKEVITEHMTVYIMFMT